MPFFVNTLRVSTLRAQAQILKEEAVRKPQNLLLKEVAFDGLAIAFRGQRLIKKQISLAHDLAKLARAQLFSSPAALREIYRISQFIHSKLKCVEQAARVHETEMTEWRIVAFKVSLLSTEEAMEIYSLEL